MQLRLTDREPPQRLTQEKPLVDRDGTIQYGLEYVPHYLTGDAVEDFLTMWDVPKLYCGMRIILYAKLVLARTEIGRYSIRTF